MQPHGCVWARRTQLGIFLIVLKFQSLSPERIYEVRDLARIPIRVISFRPKGYSLSTPSRTMLPRCAYESPKRNRLYFLVDLASFGNFILQLPMMILLFPPHVLEREPRV
jgi:hypothetical protein